MKQIKNNSVSYVIKKSKTRASEVIYSTRYSIHNSQAVDHVHIKAAGKEHDATSMYKCIMVKLGDDEKCKLRKKRKCCGNKKIYEYILRKYGIYKCC